MAQAGDSIEQLEIFQLAKEIGNLVWQLASKWSMFAQKTVGTQLVRSADSVGANIAEGYGRHFYAETLQFLYYSRGSLEETKFWLSAAIQRNLIKQEDIHEINRIMEKFPIKLNAYIKYIRKLKNNRPLN